MSVWMGETLKIEIFGQSHSESIGVTIEGLPDGMEMDMEAIQKFLERRKAGKNAYSTARSETDEPHIVSGVLQGRTCGTPLCALFENKNVRSEDYDKIKNIPRPSHADYTAFVKYQGNNDNRGGGAFSGRMTLPLCFAGAICKQLLEEKEIYVGAHILSIGSVKDRFYDAVDLSKEDVVSEGFPVLDSVAGQKMVQLMEETAKDGDSIGGVIECGVTGMPAGVGGELFDGLEGKLALALFGIPAVKGVEFGAGFAATAMKGSECNDAFCIKNNRVETITNHSGGIQGGISNGMPMVMRVAVKPTPSIYKEQPSVDLGTMRETTLQIEGRHDPCIVPRAVPCVEAACAIVLYDIISRQKRT